MISLTNILLHIYFGLNLFMAGAGWEDRAYKGWNKFGLMLLVSLFGSLLFIGAHLWDLIGERFWNLIQGTYYWYCITGRQKVFMEEDKLASLNYAVGEFKKLKKIDLTKRHFIYIVNKLNKKVKQQNNG